MDTVRLHLKQDFRLGPDKVLYVKGRRTEMPKDIAIAAGLYTEPARKAVAKKRVSKKKPAFPENRSASDKPATDSPE